MARGILEGFEGGRLTEKFELARAGRRLIAAMSLDQTDLLPANFRQQPRGWQYVGIAQSTITKLEFQILTGIRYQSNR